MVAGISSLSRGLGLTGSRLLGRLLGDGWYGIDVAHRRVARGNLRLAFPDWTSRRCATVSRAAFRHFAEVGLDLLRFPLYDAEACAHRTRVRGWEHLEAASDTVGDEADQGRRGEAGAERHRECKRVGVELLGG